MGVHTPGAHGSPMIVPGCKSFLRVENAHGFRAMLILLVQEILRPPPPLYLTHEILFFFLCAAGGATFPLVAIGYEP